MMEYKIIRSDRKTLAIEITRDADVVVRAPLRMPIKDIERFIAAHEKWIITHSEKAKTKAAARKELSQEEIETLRKRAKEIIPVKVEHFSKLMGLYPTGIRITSAKTRYGSCSGKNSLCFSLYLMLESEEFIDYVVVHELAHIKHKNHGKLFHALTEKYVKNPKKKK